jgi:hypothetical protein
MWKSVYDVHKIQMPSTGRCVNVGTYYLLALQPCVGLGFLHDLPPQVPVQRLCLPSSYTKDSMQL